MGLGITGAILAFGFIFLNPGQCPADYTQEQIDSSGCMVGANIGLGLIVLFVAPVALTSLVLAVVALVRRITGKK